MKGSFLLGDVLFSKLLPFPNTKLQPPLNDTKLLLAVVSCVFSLYYLSRRKPLSSTSFGISLVTLIGKQQKINTPLSIFDPEVI